MHIKTATSLVALLAVATVQQNVIQATIGAVQSKYPTCSNTVSVTQISIVSTYALTTWLCGEGGGQALLTVNNKRVWSALAVHGGQMDASILIASGVPRTTANSLEANLGPVPTATP